VTVHLVSGTTQLDDRHMPLALNKALTSPGRCAGSSTWVRWAAVTHGALQHMHCIVGGAQRCLVCNTFMASVGIARYHVHNQPPEHQPVTLLGVHIRVAARALLSSQPACQSAVTPLSGLHCPAMFMAHKQTGKHQPTGVRGSSTCSICAI
jgi:hypothetical protein